MTKQAAVLSETQTVDAMLRARTIQAVHDAVAKDLGESVVNAKVCRELWAKIVPGITEQFDSLERCVADREQHEADVELSPF